MRWCGRGATGKVAEMPEFSRKEGGKKEKKQRPREY